MILQNFTPIRLETMDLRLFLKRLPQQEQQEEQQERHSSDMRSVPNVKSTCTCRGFHRTFPWRSRRVRHRAAVDRRLVMTYLDK